MAGRAAFLALALAVAAAASAGVSQRLPGGTSVRSGEVKPDAEAERAHQRQSCQAKIDAARERLSEQNWGEARSLLDSASMIAIDVAQTRQILSLYRQVDTEGRRQLQQATAAYSAGQYLQAIRDLERIRRVFGALPSAMEAKQALERAEKDPAAQAALQEAKAEAVDELIGDILAGARQAASQASSQPATAPGRVEQIKQIDLERQVRVVKLLEQVSELYAASQTGKRAAADLEALRADEAFMAVLNRHLHEQKADSLLQQAQAYQQI